MNVRRGSKRNPRAEKKSYKNNWFVQVVPLPL
jgi:hypothetical protein